MNPFPYLTLARKESLKSKHKFKIGCVIISAGRIISKGYNEVRHLARGKRYTNYPESLHAERRACSKVKREVLKGATIFIYREYADGTPAMAAPCVDCFELLKDMKLKAVYYTVSEFPFYTKIKL